MLKEKITYENGQIPRDQWHNEKTGHQSPLQAIRCLIVISVEHVLRAVEGRHLEIKDHRENSYF